MAGTRTVVSALPAAATGPARLRRTLRRDTRRLHTALAGARCVKGVESRLPGSLFGDDLAAILSHRLRSLLAQDRSAGPAPRRRERDGVAEPRRRDEGVGRHDWPPSAGRADRMPWPDRPAASTGSDAWDLEPPRGEAPAPVRPAVRPPTPGASQPQPAPSGHADRRPTRFPESPLVRTLRDYWQVVAQDARRHERPEIPPVEHRHRRRSADVDGQGRAPAGVERGMDGIAARMQAFARNVPGTDASLRPFSRGWPADALRPPPPVTATPFTREAQRDLERSNLAEALADVLREQAIQHGVDIS